MPEELKPCPFCGGEGQISPDEDIVYCIECGVSYADFDGKTAIELWNTRHESEELPEWLKQAIKTRIYNLSRMGGTFSDEHTLRVYVREIEQLEWVLSLKPPEKTGLKSCPFCDWPAKVTPDAYGSNHVHCSNSKCGAHIEHLEVETLKGSAITAWNQRVELKKIPEWLKNEIEAIRREIQASEYGDWEFAIYSNSEQFHLMQKEIDAVLCRILSLKPPVDKEGDV